MWPFRKPKALPEVTNESYSRWLRAQRPPWLWFLELDEETQEQLAILGDEHNQDVAIAIGHAVQDPATADAALSAAQGDLEAEETLARSVAANLVGKILQRREASTTRHNAPQADTPLSMGGVFDRRRQTKAEREAARQEGRRLFGRPPDEVSA